MVDDKLNCKLDGKALCIEGKDFVDIMESDSYFMELGTKQHEELEAFFKKNQDNKPDLVVELKEEDYEPVEEKQEQKSLESILGQVKTNIESYEEFKGDNTAVFEIQYALQGLYEVYKRIKGDKE